MTHGPRVLLVDSSADERSMYGQHLRLLGYDAIESETTDDALRSAVYADVIVTDVRVPGSFDGFELIRHLRSDDRTKLTPVVVITGWTLKGDRERAVAAGCDAFFLKPCLPETWCGEVARLVAQSAALRNASTQMSARARAARAVSEGLARRAAKVRQTFGQLSDTFARLRWVLNRGAERRSGAHDRRRVTRMDRRRE